MREARGGRIDGADACQNPRAVTAGECFTPPCMFSLCLYNDEVGNFNVCVVRPCLCDSGQGYCVFLAFSAVSIVILLTNYSWVEN